MLSEDNVNQKHYAPSSHVVHNLGYGTYVQYVIAKRKTKSLSMFGFLSVISSLNLEGYFQQISSCSGDNRIELTLKKSKY